MDYETSLAKGSNTSRSLAAQVKRFLYINWLTGAFVYFLTVLNVGAARAVERGKGCLSINIERLEALTVDATVDTRHIPTYRADISSLSRRKDHKKRNS